MSLVIEQMPDAFVRIAPELASIELPSEQRADCGRCHMIAPEGSVTSPRRFNPETRCCTYHPTMPNFLIGRALARGGEGARLVRARIAVEDGVGPKGIKPSRDWIKRHYYRARDDFGRNVEQRCPYWVGGDWACGVWTDRGAVCRTWFCRFEHGRRGHVFWHNMQGVIELIEAVLATWAVAQGGVPEPGDPDAWEAWYRRCDERVAAISDDQLAALRDGALETGLSELLQAHAALDGPMPDVLVPRVQHFRDSDSGVWIWGYSTYDARELPRTIFLLLSAMDGERRWQDAIAEARSKGLVLDDDAFRDLFLAGIVGLDPTPAELQAGGHLQSLTLYNVDESELPFEPE